MLRFRRFEWDVMCSMRARAGTCLGAKRVELEVESRDSGDLWQGGLEALSEF